MFDSEEDESNVNNYKGGFGPTSKGQIKTLSAKVKKIKDGTITRIIIMIRLEEEIRATGEINIVTRMTEVVYIFLLKHAIKQVMIQGI